MDYMTISIEWIIIIFILVIPSSPYHSIYSLFIQTLKDAPRPILFPLWTCSLLSSTTWTQTEKRYTPLDYIFIVTIRIIIEKFRNTTFLLQSSSSLFVRPLGRSCSPFPVFSLIWCIKLILPTIRSCTRTCAEPGAGYRNEWTPCIAHRQADRETETTERQSAIIYR